MPGLSSTSAVARMCARLRSPNAAASSIAATCASTTSSSRAVARDHVSLAQYRTQFVADAHQHGVRVDMAALFIDPLEVVDVVHQHGERPRVRRVVRVEDLAEAAAVRQARQRIRQRCVQHHPCSRRLLVEITSELIAVNNSMIDTTVASCHDVSARPDNSSTAMPLQYAAIEKSENSTT